MRVRTSRSSNECRSPDSTARTYIVAGWRAGIAWEVIPGSWGRIADDVRQQHRQQKR